MTNILKTIIVLTLASIIAFSGILASIYYINTPFSPVTVLAFIYAYFILLKPITKYWAGFLILLAEHRNLKEVDEQNKAIAEKIINDMRNLSSENEQERERVINEYKKRLDDIHEKLKEKQKEEQDKQN